MKFWLESRQKWWRFYCIDWRIFFIYCYFFFLHLSGTKSPQISRTLLSILAEFSRAVVHMIAILPLISRSTIPLYQTFEDRFKAHQIIGITVIVIFYSFFQSSDKIQVFVYSFVFFFFFSLWFDEVAKSIV